ncbi:MAG: hypothetical protein AAGG75_04445 [Bacteroidota bacterium]
MFFRIIGCTAMLSLFLFSCQPASAPVQALWDEVMVVHDEVMPKMGDMTKIKKKLKTLDKNPSIEAAIVKLEDADKAMWDWMHNMKSMSDVKELEEGAALKYLEEEKVKIDEVKRLMLESMQEGEALLKTAAN